MFPVEKRKQVSSARQRRRETVVTPDCVLTFVGADFPTWPLDHAHPEPVKLLSESRVYCSQALPWLLESDREGNQKGAGGLRGWINGEKAKVDFKVSRGCFPSHFPYRFHFPWPTERIYLSLFLLLKFRNLFMPYKKLFYFFADMRNRYLYNSGENNILIIHQKQYYSLKLKRILE